MLSRVADSLYWMCRYIERAENIARFLNVNYNLVLDNVNTNGAVEGVQWEPIISVTGDLADFMNQRGVATRENVIDYLAFDPNYAHSIIACLRSARENARCVREILPTELWEQINRIYLRVEDAAQISSLRMEPGSFFMDIVRESALFSGIASTTMTHDDGWHFCRLGNMIERADKTSRIVDVKYFYLLPSTEDVGSTLDNLQWSALLKSVSALQAYRQTYGLIEPAKVLSLLLLNREFPRAVRYCIDRMLTSLYAISGAHPNTFSNRAERKCGQLAAGLTYASIDDIVLGGVHEYIDKLQQKLNDVGLAIFEQFFAIQKQVIIPDSMFQGK